LNSVQPATTFSEVPEHTLSPAEKYIQKQGGQTNERELGGCTFSILNNGSLVTHRYPGTLKFEDIKGICALYFPGYKFSKQTTFVVAKPEQ
jgi:hypothetical protein